MKKRMFAKKLTAAALCGAMFVSAFPVSAAAPATAAQEKVSSEVLPAAYTGTLLSAGHHPGGQSQGQPFAGGTGNSPYFRIPALITLQNGWLMAAADARWETSGDGGGLDTMVSISKDGGDTWEYSFPLYFPDSKGYAGTNATTIIDPVLIQGSDGTIYLMADVNPTGVTTMSGFKYPNRGTGYITVDGTERLALTSKYANVNTAPTDDNTTVYEYYVGDLGEDGYAPVIDRATKTASKYVVDECYNLFEIVNGIKVPLTQTQVNNTSEEIQQNAFYKASSLHVYNTGYMWQAYSKDNGQTWHHRILNPQIKRDTETILLVSPGRGLVTSDGIVMISFYAWDETYSSTKQQGTFIFSKDNGETWTRTPDIPFTSNEWSSENEMVELPDGTIRMFVRSGKGAVCYMDAVWDETSQNYKWQGEQLISTNVPCTSSCNVSAIKYSKEINGKDAILVTYPGGSGRANGKIFVFLLNEADNSMELAYTYAVNTGTYQYSCLTELSDGRIGLLYENGGAAITYEEFKMEEIAEGCIIDGVRTVDVPLYGTVSETFSGAFTPDEMPDESIVSLEIQNGSVTYTGKKEGSVSFVEKESGVTYVINVAAEQMERVPVVIGQEMEIRLDNLYEMTHEPDPAVAKVELVNNAESVEKVGCHGFLGTDASYNGEKVPLTKALYTFKKGADNTVTVSATTDSGTKVYVTPHSGGAGYPNVTSEGSLIFTANDDGTFHLKANNAYGGYLFFWRNGNNCFDQQSGTADATKFKIYRPAANGENGSKEIPGYVQVTSMDGISDGGQYLIVADYDGTNFALYPSADTGNKYSHVIKVDPSAEVGNTSLKITGVAPGVTDVMMSNGIIYRIVVCTHEGKRYTVTLDADGGEVEIESLVLTYGAPIEELPVPVKEGYRFDGWFDKDGNQIKVGDTYEIDGASTLTAKWTSLNPDKPTPEQPAPYTDVQKGEWFYNYVNRVYQKNLMTGLDKTTFGPGQTLVRAQFATILYRMENKPSVKYSAKFQDVLDNGDFYVKPVLWAASEKVVTGYTNGNFGPNDQITREQMALMMFRYANYKKYDTSEREALSKFPDENLVSGYAKEAMQWCVAKGIISGQGEGTKVLNPQGSTSRAECATIISRFSDIFQ